MGIGVKLTGFFDLDCISLSCLAFLCAKASILLCFQFCQIRVYVYYDLYDLSTKHVLPCKRKVEYY